MLVVAPERRQAVEWAVMGWREQCCAETAGRVLVRASADARVGAERMTSCPAPSTAIAMTPAVVMMAGAAESRARPVEHRRVQRAVTLVTTRSAESRARHVKHRPAPGVAVVVMTREVDHRARHVERSPVSLTAALVMTLVAEKRASYGGSAFAQTMVALMASRVERVQAYHWSDALAEERKTAVVGCHLA